MPNRWLLFILACLLSVSSFAQIPVQRAPSTITVMDSRLKANLNLIAPRYADTTAANVKIGLDSLGAIIYTNTDTAFWYRAINVNGTKQWRRFGSGTGGGSGMANPMNTTQDIIVGGTGGTPTRLGVGANGTILHVDGSGNLVYFTPGQTDVVGWLTYQPAPIGRIITINGVAQDLTADRIYTVTDANLSTSNITTNNATTAKHGFLPILPNDATKYLDGTGAYSVPPGTGGSAAFATLTDVALSGLANKQFPQYNSGSAKWVNHTLLYTDLPNMSDNRLLGNFSGGATTPQEVTLGAGLHKSSSNVIFADSSVKVYVSPLVVNPTGDTISCPTCAGGTGPMTTLGDLIYEDATPIPARLPGNTSATLKILSQTGTGAISAVPAWLLPNAANVNGWLGYTALTNARTLTINSTAFDLTADRAWTITDANLSTSDITTNNSSTSKHGFLKKLDNTAQHFMDGTGNWSTPVGSTPLTTLGDIIYEDATPLPARLAGNTTTTPKVLKQTGNGSISAVPVWGQVAESELTFTNITTNNASITKHGFLPILPNDATKYLDGTGAYSTPPGSLGGTVTNFSAGDLSPLFTTTEATTTTTPALSFALTNAGANTVFGRNAGSTGAPAYFAPGVSEVSGWLGYVPANATGSTPQVPYYTAGNTLGGDDAFRYDATNHAIKIGMASTGTNQALYLKYNRANGNIFFSDTLPTSPGTANAVFAYMNGGLKNMTANDNTIMCALCATSITSGGGNVILGRSTAVGLTTGGGNVYINAISSNMVAGTNNVGINGTPAGDYSNTFSLKGAAPASNKAVFGDSSQQIMFGYPGNLGVPASPLEQDIYYDKNSHNYKFYNGTTYLPMGGGNVILRTTNTTLDQFESIVVLTSGTPTVTLPSASAVTNKKYTIVNQTGTGRTISSYLDFTGSSATTITANSAITIQSDGTNWYRIE